tara:strand:+ start:855 stop:977 length:123 start_codon:yes stop_codon:yes gene_type:complete
MEPLTVQPLGMLFLLVQVAVVQVSPLRAFLLMVAMARLAL